MSQTGFETGWLNERFRFDNAARNPPVEQAFLQFLSAKQSITIVDIGSGTGANCLYFLEKSEHDQQWFLVEKDSRFAQPTIQKLVEFAERSGYDFQTLEDLFKIETVTKKVSISLVKDDFFRLPELVDLKKVDVVMAAAVFDLLSEDQFIALADNIFSNQIALLTTLNYTGMSFQPELSLDKKYIALYESHMNRRQDFGKAMGKNAAVFIEKYFHKKGYPFIKGESIWQVSPADLKMHDYLFGFMENSISQMLSEADEIHAFQQWLSDKRSLSQNQLLAIEVQHVDFFLSPR